MKTKLPAVPPQIDSKSPDSTIAEFRLKNGEFSPTKAKRALKKLGYNVLSVSVDSSGNLQIEIKV